jgi:hypothetical protein
MAKATTKFQNKLNEKIAEAQKANEKSQEKAMEKLLENNTFIETQRAVAAKERELKELNEIIFQLNAVAPYVAKDGRKFGINVFPIAVFGIGLGSVMGILAGSRGAFIDEKMMEYSAITGISMLELHEAQSAIGSPAYFKDGKVHDAIPGNFTKLKAILQGVFIKLGLSEFKADDVTEDKFDLYFATAEARANKQFAESEELGKLEKDAEDFVLED